MITRVLMDTGPLVAILSPDDEHHRACVEQLKDLAPPLLTCWPVITEAAWLLRHRRAALRRLLLSSDTGLLSVLALDDGALPWIARFLQRYDRMDAQLADACLVYLADREGLDTVFTLDRRDFSIYRPSGARSFQVLP